MTSFLKKLHKIFVSGRTFFLALFLMQFVLGCTFRDEKISADEEARQLGKLVDASFPTINQYVIQPKCLRCHSTATPNNHGIDLSSYESMINSPVFPPLIVPGDAVNSSLYTSMLSGDMPKDGRKLPDIVLNRVRDWINNGALKTGKGDGGDDKPCDGGDPDCGLPPICEPDEPGCDDICTEPDEPGCKQLSCEPGEPGCF